LHVYADFNLRHFSSNDKKTFYDIAFVHIRDSVTKTV